MANYNKITVNDEVIIDLTQDTITKEKVPSGLTFHDKSGAVQTGTMPAQGTKTITPSTSTQTAVPSGVYTTGAVTVAPIPSNYEDVVDETNAYTEKIEQLTTAITALEEELAGKANSGSDKLNTNTCSIKITVPSSSNYYVQYESVKSEEISYNISRAYTADPISKTVRCDSIMYISASTIKGVTVSDGEMIKLVSGYGIVYKTPSSSSETITITLTA